MTHWGRVCGPSVILVVLVMGDADFYLFQNLYIVHPVITYLFTFKCQFAASHQVGSPSKKKRGKLDLLWWEVCYRHHMTHWGRVCGPSVILVVLVMGDADFYLFQNLYIVHPVITYLFTFKCQFAASHQVGSPSKKKRGKLDLLWWEVCYRHHMTHWGRVCGPSVILVVLVMGDADFYLLPNLYCVVHPGCLAWLSLEFGKNNLCFSSL